MCGYGCSDRADLTEETLKKQYNLVKRRTSNNFTYNMGSHVMQFGSLAIDEEPVADYLGELNTGVYSSAHHSPARKRHIVLECRKHLTSLA